MSDLSPAARAVRNAVLATYDDSIPKDDYLWELDRDSVVAELYAIFEEYDDDDRVTASQTLRRAADLLGLAAALQTYGYWLHEDNATERALPSGEVE
jgi:hypothetical protein